MQRTTRVFLYLLAALALSVALPSLSTMRHEASLSGAAGNEPARPLAPGEAGLRATISPETGTVEVSSAQSAAPLDAGTAEALRRDTEGLVPTFHPDGAVSVHLQGRFQSASVAHLDENGKLIVCSEHADDLRRFMAGRAGGDASTPPLPEVR